MSATRFRRFEDILAWQQARSIVNEIYTITTQLPAFREDPHLAERLQSRAIDVMTLIARGFTSQHPMTFFEALREALNTLAEVQTLLYVSGDQERIDRRRFEHMFNTTQICQRMIRELMAILGRKIDAARRSGKGSPGPRSANSRVSPGRPGTGPEESPTRRTAPVKSSPADRDHADSIESQRPDFISTTSYEDFIEIDRPVTS